MRLLLDTNVISDFVRGEASVQANLRSVAPADIAVSSITVIEIAYGLARNPPVARRIGPLIDVLLGSITVLAYSVEDARETGRIRSELEQVGRPIGLCDAMLAGVARSRDLLMITNNVAEFSRVPDLRCSDWRTST